MTRKTHKKLSMLTFLEAVRDHKFYAYEYLREQGYHHKVIVRKAEKAGDKGYTDYGTWSAVCWLEDRGRQFLLAHASMPSQSEDAPTERIIKAPKIAETFEFEFNLVSDIGEEVRRLFGWDPENPPTMETLREQVIEAVGEDLPFDGTVDELIDRIPQRLVDFDHAGAVDWCVNQVRIGRQLEEAYAQTVRSAQEMILRMAQETREQEKLQLTAERWLEEATLPQAAPAVDGWEWNIPPRFIKFDRLNPYDNIPRGAIIDLRAMGFWLDD